MRRKEKELTEVGDLEEIIRGAEVCRIGLCDRGEPYIVPVNFGYRDKTLFIHSAPEGRKIEVIRANPRVCFEMEVDVEIVPGAKACRWGTRYASVIGYGTATLVEDEEGKKAGLEAVVRHYSDTVCDFSDFDLNKVAIIAVAVESMTGKASSWRA